MIMIMIMIILNGSLFMWEFFYEIYMLPLHPHPEYYWEKNRPPVDSPF